MDDVILTGTSTSCSGTYTITYNGNGNTGGSVPVDGTSYASGTSVTVLGNTGSLVKSGCYIFDGWATTAGGAVAYTAGQTFAITASTNLYAHWTSTSFAVTFNNNGGSGSMSNQSNCVAANLNSNTFTKSCATFAGWNTASNGSGTAYADNASYNFTANTTLYAQWTSTSHTVIFNNNGGSGSMSNQTACVSTALTSNAFTKSGCLFTGWNTAADGSGTTYSNNATYSFSSDISLYAQWDCSICINEDFESGLPTGGYSTGSWALTSGVWTGTNVIRGTVPHSGSYDCQLQGTTGSNIVSPSVTNPLTLSFWASISSGSGSSLQVAYSSDGGATWTQVTGSPFSLTTTYQQFTVNLNLAGSFQIRFYRTNSTVYLDDITVTCGTPHTVTFNANGGSGSMSNQTASSTTNLSSNAFTNGSCTFTGWNTAANGSGTAYANNAAYSFSLDMTIYAQWNCAPTHTVTFNSNGGSGSMSNQTSNVSTNLISNAFTNSGCTFVNWNDSANANGTSYANSAVYSFTADVTLYAQWNCTSGGGSAGCPYLVSAVINACAGSCNAEGKNEIVVMNSGNYSIPVNGSNINLYYSGGTNHYFTNSFAASSGTVVSNLNTMTSVGGCTNTPFVFVPSGGTIPANSNFMILNNNSCFNGDFSAYCNTGPVYVIISTDADWASGGYFGNNSTPRYFRTDFSNVNSGCGLTTYNYNNPSTFGFGSDGASVLFNGTASPTYINGTGTCAPSIIILPIELIDFYATQNGSRNDLVWKVASEKNVIQYIIEKSEDGLIFKELTRLNSNGAEGYLYSYNVQDTEPYDEITYYRLSTLEDNGKTNNYKIIDIDRSNKNWETIIYQNNNDLVLEFKKNVPKNAVINLFDLSGKLIADETIKDFQTKINIKTISSGIYFARITTPYKSENFKIIILND